MCILILIQAHGAKWWRFRYRWKGREARKQRDAAGQQLAQGINPAADRQRKRNSIDRSFERVARDGLACVLELVLAGKRSRDAYEKAENPLESYSLPELGREDVNSIRPSQLLSVLRRTEAKGLLERARRTEQRCVCVKLRPPGSCISSGGRGTVSFYFPLSRPAQLWARPWPLRNGRAASTNCGARPIS